MTRLFSVGVLAALLTGLPSSLIDGAITERLLDLELRIRGLTLNDADLRADLPVELLVRTQISHGPSLGARPKLSVNASIVHRAQREVVWSKRYELELSSLGEVQEQLGVVLGEAFRVANPGDLDWQRLIHVEGLFDI